MFEVGFILSTGRTGTKFFEKFLTDNFHDVLCLHEPKPSRRFKIYSNLYLNGKLSGDFIASQFIKTRNKILQNHYQKAYIESNNFMFGCVPALNNNFGGIKILHIIRNPETYIVSHLNHGFWKGHKKIFAKCFPYWIEKLELNKQEKSNPLALLAYRWNYVNTVIEGYSITNPYLLERFEDIFSPVKEISEQTIKRIINFFELPDIKEDVIRECLVKKSNASKPNKADYKLNEEEKAYIQNICKIKMAKYEYLK